MDVAHPIRAVVPSLDGPVLEVLAGTTLPLSTLKVHRLARTGSPNGVRKVLERLALEGIALADPRGNATYYVANREHLAWPAVEMLVGLRRSMLEQLEGILSRWTIRPLHASVFGSTARADGDARSDIDIFIIKPVLSSADDERWGEQLDDLRVRVLALTGNRCQAFDLTSDRLSEHVAAHDPLVQAWLDDGVHLIGDPLSTIVAVLRSKVPG
jgi:predicted nucleotidyltransferase